MRYREVGELCNGARKVDEVPRGLGANELEIVRLGK